MSGFVDLFPLGVGAGFFWVRWDTNLGAVPGCFPNIHMKPSLSHDDSVHYTSLGGAIENRIWLVTVNQALEVFEVKFSLPITHGFQPLDRSCAY